MEICITASGKKKHLSHTKRCNEHFWSTTNLREFEDEFFNENVHPMMCNI
jgi:hypothetical protein